MTRPSAMRIGGGAAFFNDRIDATLALIQRGGLDAVIMDALAERTLAMLHAAHRAGGPPYFPALPARMAQLLPACHAARTTLVSNCGGIDPEATAQMIAEVARGCGLAGLRIAAVSGDDLASGIAGLDPVLLETGAPLSALGRPAMAANAYLGAQAIAEACRGGADVVVTGRVTDSALALGPLMAGFGWPETDLDAMACGVLTGHLLECGAQATGGYFAEPGLKEVPGLDDLGFPIAEVGADLGITLSKTPGTGGRVDRHTVTEQILYEMHDPAAYVTPDVVLDITALTLTQAGPDVVRLAGARGHAPPARLKALVGVDSGVLVEAEISYAGINAQARAMLAREVLQRRFARTALAGLEFRYDLIGVDSLWPGGGSNAQAVRDLRLRVAVRVPDRAAAELVITEVDGLYVNGPAGGGGVRTMQRDTIRTYTAFVDRAAAPPRCRFVEA